MTVTNEQQKAYIAALLRERLHYTTHNLPERVKAVDEELAKAGHGAKPPAKAAVKATPPARTEL